MSPVGRQMQNRKFGFYLLCTVVAALGTIIATSVTAAQVADVPWKNPKLSPEERADMVLKQLTLDEKLALLHGNGMAHAPQWQMPCHTLPTAVRDTLRASSAWEFLPW